MAYDFVVVGAGLFGATVARTLTDRGKKVLVIDAKDHIGGMCYTEVIDGIIAHRYGPHVFHTSDDRIWKWVNRFASFYQFMVRTKVIYEEKIYSLPFNLMTFNQLWGVVTPAEAMQKIDSLRVPIGDPKTVEEWALSQLGHEIYDKFIFGYTVKQWGRHPKQLPASILKRLPIRFTFDDNYFSDKYQGLPEGGYTAMFERMLDGIEVRLGTDFFSDRALFEHLGNVIYSGRIDRYFDYVYGPLAFRSCEFETKVMDGDFQGNPVIHHSSRTVPYTRVVEHKHFGQYINPKTVVTWEYPFECDQKSMPLYPVNDLKNMSLYKLYRSLPTSAIFGGRLGSYRYRDMHHVIAEALALAEKLT